MRSHFRSMAKRKVSDFLLREEGIIGRRTGFATAAVVSTSALAMTLIISPDAEAQGPNCPNAPCPAPKDCCIKYVGGHWIYRCFGAGDPPC